MENEHSLLPNFVYYFSSGLVADETTLAYSMGYVTHFVLSLAAPCDDISRRDAAPFWEGWSGCG